MANHKSLVLSLFAALSLLFMAGLPAFAQDSSRKVTVTGTVVDETGLPAIGASVIVNGVTSQGATMTDMDGRFKIDAPRGSSLQFTYVGYEVESRTVEGPGDIFVTLKLSSTFLDEAVVVGYGVQTKESLVGAISTVSSEDLAHTGSNSIMSSLSGKVSGLKTTTNNGAPGEDNTTLMLRGLSSWNGSTPLVMVDGVERAMSEISPQDVASISVLKDASATAVFGAKGANGVIIVTTKTGQEGRPKMHANVEYGFKQPLRVPNHIDSYTTVVMANEAYRNDGLFASMYSADIIEKYRTHSDPWRYPDVNWYDEMLKNFTDTYNANFNISGGSKKVKYYSAINYYRDNSIIKTMDGVGKSNYSSDRITYRLNVDAMVTKYTTVSFKFGGFMTINAAPTVSGTTVNTGQIFVQSYMSTGAVYPAYFPADIFSLYPDIYYPDAHERRLANAHGNGSTYDNPMRFLMTPSWLETTDHKITSDLILDQKLDFITKGLSLKGIASLTTSYSRNSEKAAQTIPQWNILWDQYDLGNPNYWASTDASVDNVWVQTPIAVSQENTPSAIKFVYYFEGSLNYARSFGKHNVTATAVYNQRQVNSNASFPTKNQAIVGRATYNYAKKYLLEVNAGFTGSEQFAPEYRFGFFPSVAAGYVISNEKFWKKAMPWWSTMKVRVSRGLVGSDAATSGFLYHTSYSLSSMTDKGDHARKHYVEGQAANENARWETARKTDVGLEMGWFKNALTFSVDLYDEYRYDMLITPVTTPLIGIDFKDTNTGAMSLPVIDFELNYRKTHANTFYYEVGAMLGLNENRIMAYAEIPYSPEYQKYVNTPYEAQRNGTKLVDDKYFNTIQDLHGYPLYTTAWTTVQPGQYKFLDFLPDGQISDVDMFTIPGSAYPPCTYSLNLGLGYKGFTFRMVGSGTYGKYIRFIRSFQIPFYNGELSVHTPQLDYWTPTNHNAPAPALSWDEGMYKWSGEKSATSGYNIAIPNYTWRKSDYFDINEMYFAYDFTHSKLLDRMGIAGLTLSLTCNNLFTFTGLEEGHPQLTTTYTVYYPLMRTVKLGVNVNF